MRVEHWGHVAIKVLPDEFSHDAERLARFWGEAQVVELRFFGGLSVEECAEVLGVSRNTVLRHWNHARAWLLHELDRGAQR